MSEYTPTTIDVVDLVRSRGDEYVREQITKRRDGLRATEDEGTDGQ